MPLDDLVWTLYEDENRKIMMCYLQWILLRKRGYLDDENGLRAIGTPDVRATDVVDRGGPGDFSPGVLRPRI
jgi:hypothetical protein